MLQLPKKIHWSIVILSILFFIALFLRTWNLPNSLHFLGDQGRDALIVSQIFREADLVFIGPVTSVGNMYLGPFYYYFMLPFLWLTYPSPLGPAYAIAILGSATIFFMYLWGGRLLSKRAGLFAATFMTFSVVAINHARFSWNPNPAPFVSLAMMYCTFLAWKKNPRYWWLVGLCFAVLLQLHYVTILTGVAAFIIWLISLIQRVKSRSWKPLILPTIGAIIILALSTTPLMLFDFKHDWTNAKAFQSLLSSDQNFAQAEQRVGGILTVIRETHGRAMHILFEFTVGKMRHINTLLLLFTIALTSFFIYKGRSKPELQKGIWVVVAWLLVGIIGLSFYQHTVFDHYIAFLFPATFLLYGYIFDQAISFGKAGWLLLGGFFFFFLWYNLPLYNFKPTGPTLLQLRQTAEEIQQQVEPDEKYALILLSSSKDLYGMNYRYYLHIDKSKAPVSPENHLQAEKLIIINEEQVAEDPVALPIYEIVTFGEYEILDERQLSTGVEVIILSKRGQVPDGGV